MEYIENVQGKNIIITNSNGDNANSVRLLGDIKQNNYTGRNLFNFRDTTSVSSGVTADDDGWITATYNNSSGSSTVYLNYYTNNLNLQVNTNYNIMIEIKSVSGTGNIDCPSHSGNSGQFKNNITTPFSSLTSNSVISIVKPTKDSFTNVTSGLRTFVRFNAGQSGSITFRISVLADTSITPSQFVYEPYVGETQSPNPNYPQEVKTVKGITNLYDYSFRTTSMTIRTARCTCTEENGIFTMVTSDSGDSYIWEITTSGNAYGSAAGQLFEFEEDDYRLNISDTTLSNNYITYYDKNKVSLGYIRKESNVVRINKNDKSGAKYFSIRIGQHVSLGAGVTHVFTVQLTKGVLLYDYMQYGKHINYVKSAGKNLLDTSKIHLPKLNGLNAKLDNAKLTLNGNNTAQGYIISNNSNTSVVIDEGTYRFSIKILGGSSNITDSMPGNIAFNIKKYTDLNTILGGVDLKSALRSQTGVNATSFTVTSPTVIGVEAYTNATTFIYDNLEIGIQLEKSDGATEWEPYIGKTYQIDVSKKNLFDKSNIVEQASIDSSGKIVFDANANIYYIPVESGKKYVIHQGYIRQYVYSFFTNIPTLGSTGASRTIVPSAKDVIVTVPNGYNYLVFRDYITSSIENNETLIVTEGTEIYNELCKIGDYQDSFIKGTGKNLLKIPTSVSRTFNGITYKVNDDGSVSINGTVTSGSGFTVDLDNPIELDGMYTMTLKCVGTTNTNANQQWLLRASDNTSIFSPTISSDMIKSQSDIRNITATKLEIYTAANATINMTVYPQLELNNGYTGYTGYEPYGAKDKWLLHKEIGKIVLDGSESIAQATGGGQTLTNLFMLTKNDYNSQQMYSTHFTNVVNAQITDNINANNNLNIGQFSARVGTKDRLYFKWEGTLSNFKTWLSNNNVTVYYQLSNSMNTLITNTDLIKQLDTLDSMELPYGNTKIDSIGDIPAILDVNYNNWNKDINPSDRAALLDGTATIETEIEVHNENLFDKNEYNMINGYIQGSTGKILVSDGDYIIYIPCKSGTEYTIHKSLATPSNSNRFRIGSSSNIPALNTVLSDVVFSNDIDWYEDTYTYTTSSDANYLVVYFYTIANNPSKTLLEVLNSIVIEEGTPTILNQNNSVISWNHEDFRYVKDEGFIGQFVARQLTGELKDLDDDFNITDKELHLKLGVRTNNNTNWYSLGNFLTTKVTNDEVKDKTSFESLDYAKKFNKKYEDTITYPCTARDLALNVCEQCGVELATPVFKNYDYVIEGNVFKNNETCRDVMKAIGKLAFSWIRVDWDNKVYLDFTKEIVQRDYDDADNSQYYNLTTQKEKFGPVNRIVIGYSQIDGERTFISDDESIEENGECELTIYDNPLVYNAEQRDMIIESARDLMGLDYMPLNTLTIGHPWLKGKELFNIIDMEGNTHKTIPFDRTIQYFGHIKTLIDVTTATKTENSLAYKPDIEKGLMETEIQVNKNTGDITSLTRRTETVEDGLGNTYTIEQTNQLIQNASTGITNTFSEAGGNNIFRNTGLWFEQNDNVTKTGKNLCDNIPLNLFFNRTMNKVEPDEDCRMMYTKVPKNTNITVSKTSVTNRFRICLSDEPPAADVTYVETGIWQDDTSTLSATINSGDHEYVLVQYTNAGQNTNIQIELGSTATPYEPYYEYTNNYEFWDGPVVKQKEESAANLNALLLQLGTFSQEQLVPNGNYTISFKYKKLIQLANVKCVINDVEYVLTGTGEKEFIQTIEVSSQHINIKFKNDINDSCEIYDLMVNAGSVKLAYSQNQNETTTDTVNISKGITITSSDTDTTFKANADGIRTLDKNGNVKTRFTDTGMTTKQQIVEEKAEIVGVLIQGVGSQTWLTRL